MESFKTIDGTEEVEVRETFFLQGKNLQVPNKPGNDVNHPKHYNMHPSGVECIDIIEHLPYNIGAAIKYLWRADYKGMKVQDYDKAIWYIQRERARVQRQKEEQEQMKESQKRFHNKKRNKEAELLAIVKEEESKDIFAIYRYVKEEEILTMPWYKFIDEFKEE